MIARITETGKNAKILLAYAHSLFQEDRMPAEKSLRERMADIIGISSSSPEARALYMLVDKIEVLEEEIRKLKERPTNPPKF